MVNKIIKILLIILLTILVVGLIAVFVLLLNNKIDLNISQSKLIYDEIITESFNNIQVSTKSLDIKLIKSNDLKANVKVYDRKDSELSVKVEDNTLKIENERHTSWCFLCFGESKVVISLPEKEYDLVINATSGDIESQVDLNNATIVTTSGDIDFTKVNELVLTVTSGDIEINEVNSITITSTSGDVEIGKVNNSLNIETTSGDIDIDNLTIMKDSNIKVKSGDVTINKTADNIYYNATATSGDVKITNNNRHADYELKIDTKSGDIKVK